MLEEGKDGEERTTAGNTVYSTSTRSATLLSASRLRQVTEEKTKQEEGKAPLSQITYSFALGSKSHLLYYKSDGTGNPAFFFFLLLLLLLQGKTTLAQQKQNNIPGRSLGLSSLMPDTLQWCLTDAEVTHPAQSRAPND
jgi:hypothetical protein